MSIGEFARLAGVSVRMLRHYDAIGLLEPTRVDEFTGYRFYAAHQLDRANRLVALKELGFGLDEVGTLLADDGGSERVVAMLRARRDELRAQIATDQHRVTLVEARLRLIEKEYTMSTHEMTALPALSLVQELIRTDEISQVGALIAPMFDRVNEAIDTAGVRRIGPGIALYGADDQGSYAIAGEQIGVAATPPGLTAADHQAQPRALTTKYVAADMSGIEAAWQGLMEEVEARGLSPEGACREVYLATPFDAGSTGWNVELQAPVH